VRELGGEALGTVVLASGTLGEASLVTCGAEGAWLVTLPPTTLIYVVKRTCSTVVFELLSQPQELSQTTAWQVEFERQAS
jgi:hypothetical protein